MKKLGILGLSACILGSTVFSSVSFAAESNISKPSNAYNVQANENKGFQQISQAVINKLDPYVQRVDGKFVLNAPDSVLKTLDKKTLDMVRINIDKTNRIYDNTELKTENGKFFTGHYDLNKELTNQGMQNLIPQERASGYTAVDFYWWGFILHASGYWTETILGSGVVAAGTALGALAGGQVGAAAGIAVCTYVADRLLGAVRWDGFVVHYNWAWGVDKFYWQ